jgi:hypothetical protein
MSIAYNPSIVTSGLVFCLDAGNAKSYPGSGTSWYDVTNTNTLGSLINSPSYTSGTAGYFFFGAINNYVNLPTTLGYISQLSAFSWIKTVGTPKSGYHIVCGPTSLEISIPTSGEIRSGIDTSNGRFVSNHGSGLVDGNWHYLGFTFDGTTKSSYIDGAMVGTQSVTGTLVYSVSGRSMGVFGSGDTTYGMNGNISYYHVYNSSLTGSQVNQNFNALRGRYGI